ncbi:3-oxo-5-alpha-steroid 4-dehydrogenase 1, partial [Acropora cervicornis]
MASPSFSFTREFDELQFIYLASVVMIITAVIVAFLLIFLKAEYGRYFSVKSAKKYGFGVPPRVAWFAQELPAFVVPCILVCYAREDVVGFTPNKLDSLVLMHPLLKCFHRSLIYPWLIKGGKPTPFFLAFLAFVFCIYNGYLQARYLTQFAYYEKTWLLNPCFIFGGVFTYVSGANFFGEIVEWSGFALACWSLPSLAFAVFTALNI